MSVHTNYHGMARGDALHYWPTEMAARCVALRLNEEF